MDVRTERLNELFFVYHKNLKNQSKSKYSRAVNYLKRRGFNLQDFLKVGGGVGYLQNKEWLNLPLYSFDGNLIGFLNRKVSYKKEFLYTPFNKPPSKSKAFVGLRELVIKDNSIYLVEGDFDWLAFRKAGILNSLPLCGLSISNQQVQWLKQKKIKKIFICFDNDLAGKNGAKNLKEYLTKQGFITKVIEIKAAAKDWNDLFLLNNSNWSAVLTNQLLF
ncbi:DNA primase-like protein [Mycoplasmoides genitalium]